MGGGGRDAPFIVNKTGSFQFAVNSGLAFTIRQLLMLCALRYAIVKLWGFGFR